VFDDKIPDDERKRGLSPLCPAWQMDFVKPRSGNRKASGRYSRCKAFITTTDSVEHVNTSHTGTKPLYSSRVIIESVSLTEILNSAPGNKL